MKKEEPELKKEQPESQARKPFWIPHLRVHGHISAITQTGMGGEVMDGGTASNGRTGA
jgi:hypothetical protein